MVNLKDDIWIKGFDTIEAKNDELRYLCHVSENMLSELIYAGKTSDISEEIAKECVKEIVLTTGIFYINYRKIAALKLPSEMRPRHHNQVVWSPMCKTSEESIQSACNQEYCIIFKK